MVKEEASEGGNLIYPLSPTIPDWCINATHTARDVS